MRVPLVGLVALAACSTGERALLDAADHDAGPADRAVADQGSPDADQSPDGSSAADALPGDAAPNDGGLADGGIGSGFRTGIASEAEWAELAGPVDTDRCDYDQEVGFILPLDAQSPIQETYFVDKRRYRHLMDFANRQLGGAYDPQSWFDTFERDQRRTQLSGSILRVVRGGQVLGYAFDLVTPASFTAIDQAILARAHQALGLRFTLPLGYLPRSSYWVRQTSRLVNPPFTVYLPGPCPGEGCALGADCLIVPQGTRLCGGFADNRTVEAERANQIVLRFTPGSYELQSAGPSLALLGGGEFGPLQVSLQTPPGTLTSMGEPGGTHYSWQAMLDAAGIPLSISLEFDFLGTGPVMLREPSLSEFVAFGVIGPAMNESFHAGSCRAEGHDLFLAEGRLQGGERFRFEYRHTIPGAGSGPFFITAAEVETAAGLRRVEDYFGLLYSGAHHNWNNQLLLLLPEPVMVGGQSADGLWIDEPGTTCCPLDAVYAVDRQLGNKRPLPVASYQRAPRLF